MDTDWSFLHARVLIGQSYVRVMVRKSEGGGTTKRAPSQDCTVLDIHFCFKRLLRTILSFESQMLVYIRCVRSATIFMMNQQ